MKKLIAALVVGVFSALAVFAQTKKPPRVIAAVSCHDETVQTVFGCLGN